MVFWLLELIYNMLIGFRYVFDERRKGKDQGLKTKDKRRKEKGKEAKAKAKAEVDYVRVTWLAGASRNRIRMHDGSFDEC